MKEISKTEPPTPCSFVNLPIVTDWQDLDAQAVIFGVPYGKPYQISQFPNDQSRAPNALRAASSRILIDHEVIDTDIPGKNSVSQFKIVDGGNIPLIENDLQRHYDDAERAVRYAVKKGALPVSIGGDDGITNPVIRGLDGLNDITIIQIDAHLDWRDERFGEKDGYSSPMRRASELDHISAIHQIGIRSFGSSKTSDLEEARRWGAKIHSAQEIHADGMKSVVDSLPVGGQFFVSLDVDGLDPSVVPGTIALAPGGIMWWEMVELFEELAKKGNIVGLNVVELAPQNDLNQISMITAGRLILKLLMLQLNSSKLSS
jgi:agmatinase